jgi:hypothetical protein
MTGLEIFLFIGLIYLLVYTITDAINRVNFKYRREHLYFLKMISLQEQDDEITDEECQEVLMESENK